MIPTSVDESMKFSTDKLPVVFGRYLLLRRLSRGGMGEIFLAKLGEAATVKRLNTALSNDGLPRSQATKAQKVSCLWNAVLDRQRLPSHGLPLM